MQTLLMSSKSAWKKTTHHVSTIGPNHALCEPKGGQPLTRKVSAAEMTENEIQFARRDKARRDDIEVVSEEVG